MRREVRSSFVLLPELEFPLHRESLRASFSFQPRIPSLLHTTSPDGHFNFKSKMQSPQFLPNMLLFAPCKKRRAGMLWGRIASPSATTVGGRSHRSCLQSQIHTALPSVLNSYVPPSLMFFIKHGKKTTKARRKLPWR